MSTSGKKLSSARLMQRNREIFSCPVCGGSMEIDDDKSLLCTANHRFDLAKQGYVNLMTHPSKTKYDRAMFEARRAMNEASMFEPLLDRMSERILERLPAGAHPAPKPDGSGTVSMKAPHQIGMAPLHQQQGTRSVPSHGHSGTAAAYPGTIRLLDAGCGEGSHLTALSGKLRRMSGRDVLGAGIDISKEGVQMAARDDAHHLWIVGDLAKTPLADSSFDVILNILSPSNYAEFHRVLNDDGLLVKIIPESGYLQELRAILYAGSERQEYSNEATAELFGRNFEVTGKERVTYSVRLTPVLTEQLVHMTPLSWGAGEEQVRQVLNEHALTEMTCDFSILTGRKQNR